MWSVYVVAGAPVSWFWLAASLVICALLIEPRVVVAARRFMPALLVAGLLAALLFLPSGYYYPGDDYQCWLVWFCW